MKYVKFILTSLLLTVTTGAVFSQEIRVPDQEFILKSIIDPGSPHFYPYLFGRYERGDTTLTHNDYYFLYYGFAFQEDYNPLETKYAEDKIMMSLERNMEPDAAEANMILDYAREVFLQDPFSPRNINFMTFAYGIIGDTINERINADRLQKILYTIESSGKGNKLDSPWHILWFSHGNDLLASKGLLVQKRMIMTSKVEYVMLTEKNGKDKGYYFDYSRIYSKRPDNLPEKRSSGVTVNGIRTRRSR